MSNASSRRLGGALLLGAFLALPLALTAQVASAQCADPRGNSYCSNGGQVTFSTQPAPAQPAQQPAKPQPVQQAPQAPNPRPARQAPAPPLVNVQNPSPAQVNVQNPNPGQVNVQNPDPGEAAVSQPAPATQAAPSSGPATVSDYSSSPWLQPNTVDNSNASISIDPPVASVGDPVTITGQGFAPGRVITLNLVGTPMGAKQFDTPDGTSLVAGDDGSLSASLPVPFLPNWVSADAQVCVMLTSVCAPLSIQATADPGTLGSGGGDAAGCWSCGVVQNDAARRYGEYNSGSGNYEYHGARP